MGGRSGRISLCLGCIFSRGQQESKKDKSNDLALEQGIQKPGD